VDGESLVGRVRSRRIGELSGNELVGVVVVVEAACFVSGRDRVRVVPIPIAR
jgi:hypothetical protein